MEVSVVVPLHNGQRWIKRTIASILAEPEVAEVIVVENGSTDDSCWTVERIAESDTRVRLEYLPGHPSIPAARNFGVHRAACPFLSFCDQDDIWTPHRIQRQAVLLHSSPYAAFCIGMQEFKLSASLATAERHQIPSWCREEWIHNSQIGYVLGALLVERELFARVGFLDESLTYGFDDVDWFARARRYGLMELRLPETVLIREVHELNASANPQSRGEALRLLRRYIAENRVEE